MGYGFLGTGRDLLHIFVKGAGAAERIHYLEVDAGGGPYDAPMLMRTAGTEAAAWQVSPQEFALRTAHIHRFANAEAEKHAQTGRRRGGGVDGHLEDKKELKAQQQSEQKVLTARLKIQTTAAERKIKSLEKVEKRELAAAVHGGGFIIDPYGPGSGRAAQRSRPAGAVRAGSIEECGVRARCTGRVQPRGGSGKG